jgi:hypothetical protein
LSHMFEHCQNRFSRYAALRITLKTKDRIYAL